MREDFDNVLNRAAQAARSPEPSPITRTTPLQANLSSHLDTSDPARLEARQADAAFMERHRRNLEEARRYTQGLTEATERMRPVNSFVLGAGDPYLARTPTPVGKGMTSFSATPGRGAQQNAAKREQDRPSPALPLQRRVPYSDPTRTDAATGDVSDDASANDSSRTQAFNVFLDSKLDEYDRGDTTQNTTLPPGRRVEFTHQNVDVNARGTPPPAVVEANKKKYAKNKGVRIMSQSMRDQTILGGLAGGIAVRPRPPRPPVGIKRASKNAPGAGASKK